MDHNQYDPRTYRAGTGQDIFAVVPGNFEPNMKRDIVLEPRQTYISNSGSKDHKPQLKRIHESHQSYMPLAYPIIYQDGQPNSEYGSPHKIKSKI